MKIRSFSFDLFIGFLLFLFAIPFFSAQAFTVSPGTANYDDLIGASNATWSFSATTTASLASGDVIQFGFPNINMGPPFGLTGVGLVATTGLSIFQTSTGTPLSNKVLNPSFETASSGVPYVDVWTEFNVGSSTSATTSTASDGNVALNITSHTATSTGIIEVSNIVGGTLASTDYTVSYYARGATGGEFARLSLHGNGVCGGADQLYNFASSSFECVTPGPNTFASTSPYVLIATTTSSYARFTYTLQTAADMTQIEVGFIGGGDAVYDNESVYYDAVQVEKASSASTYNAGGVGPQVAGMQSAGNVLFGYVNSAIATGTVFSVTLNGITNTKASLNSVTNLEFDLAGGTPTDPMQPMGVLNGGFTATTSISLLRAGGAFVTDNNSQLTPSSYATGTASSFTFGFTASSSIPNGGQISINFPSEYSLGSVSVQTQNINGAGVQVTNAGLTIVTNSGENRVVLTTSNGTTTPGDAILITIDGLTNPTTAGVYRPFYIFTALDNGGLLDGSYFGFEEGDFGPNQPPPVDTVHIGGTNTLVIQAVKESGTSTVPLSGSELTQVKVGAGCPDKGFFVGDRWLNASSSASYENLLDCNYMVGAFPLDASDATFYDSFLPPGMKQIQALGGGTATATIKFGVPDATSTITITGGVPGKLAFLDAFSEDYQTFSDIFTDTTYTTPGFNGSGVGYASLRLKSGQVWNFTVGSGGKNNEANFSSGGTTYWPPVVPDLNVDSAGTYNLGSYAYIAANNTLTVSLQKTTGGAVTDACIGVKRSGGGFFMELQDVICQANSGNDYVFKVPTGSLIVEVMRPGFGAPEEYPVGISASSTAKTISVSVPTSYISVSVADSDGNALSGAPVFAHGSNGSVDGITNSAGTTTLYVQPGTYTVEGFAPGFGQLSAQSVTVTGSSNPTASFSVNIGNLRTISGTVTQGGQPVEGFKIGAHGINGTEGGNGTETASDGTYSLYVPSGVYSIGGWSPDTGGLPEQTVDVSSGSATGKDWALGGGGTLQVTITGGASLDEVFAGAFDPTTGRGNGIDTWSTSGQNKVASISLPAGTYELHIGSPALGELTSPNTQVTITSNNTTAVSYSATSSATLVTLSGTVTDGGSGVSDISVWVSKVAGPGFYTAQTDASGNYSFNVPDAQTYTIGIQSNSYIASNGAEDVAVSGNTTKNIALTAAGSTITGTLKDDGNNSVPNGWVRAVKTVSGNDVWTGAPTDAVGAFSLSVDSGAWTLYGEGPCFVDSAGVSANAGDTGKTVTVTADSGCTVPVPQLNSVTPATGAQVSRDDLTLNIPANALGSGQTAVSVQVANAGLVVSSANATPLSGSVKSITVTDSSGQSISSLNSNATLAIDYDPTELPVGFNEADLQLAYFDTTTGTWIPVAATVDTDNNIITANVSHFTDYGPILPGVPDAPTGVTATADSDTQITVSWSSVATADYYTIYRSSTDSNFTTSIATTTSTSYADTGRTASTKYYYKVAGNNSNGEGSNSSSVNATTNATAAASNGGGGGGGSSSGHIRTTTATTSTDTTTPVTTTSEATPDTTTVPVLTNIPVTTNTFAKLVQRLSFGDENAQVKLLQQMLASDSTIYPRGITSGYFGILTQEAVQRFQSKYGIVSDGTPATTGYGAVGPKTLAKLNTVFATGINTNTLGTPIVSPAISYSPLTSSLDMGVSNDMVRTLQIALNADSDTQVASAGYGAPGNETDYFGPATLHAVQKFQIKYGLAQAGDSFFGFVGPQTRAKINDILANLSTSAPVSNTLNATSRAKIVAQLQILVEKVKKLQAQLHASQASKLQ